MTLRTSGPLTIAHAGNKDEIKESPAGELVPKNGELIPDFLEPVKATEHGGTANTVETNTSAGDAILTSYLAVDENRAPVIFTGLTYCYDYLATAGSTNAGEGH